MPQTDPRVDQYIAAAPLFAQPLLVHWRAVVLETCPAAVETLKWRRPHFLYRDKLLCGMSAFKAHCAIGFWHGEVVPPGTSEPAMGQFGRLYTLDDLPPLPQQRALIRQAMALIEQGVPPARLTRLSPSPSGPTTCAWPWPSMRRRGRTSRLFRPASDVST